MEYQKLIIDISDGIALVTINNPPMNNLPGGLLRSLELCFEELANDSHVKVIIITGSGKSFATGADIDEMGKCKSAEEAGNMSKLGQSAFLKIEQCPKPVIAAIRGFCLGGGLELALSCHLRFASDRCVFRIPEIRFGMIPAFGGSYRLPAIIGTGRALQMILTAQKLNSQEAKMSGLVNGIFPGDTLLGNVRNIAATMTKMSSASMRMTINAVLKARSAGLKEIMETESTSVGKLYDMHDLKEGVYAYLDKRKPEFIDY